MLTLQGPAPPASASDSDLAAPADVRWTAPAGCPDRAALLAGIARRRGRPLEPGQARVTARARPEGPHRYRLQLELEVAGRRERRILRARTCEALVDGVALVVALAVDGNPGAPPAEATPDAPDQPVEPSEPIPPDDPGTTAEAQASPGTVPAPPPAVPIPPQAAPPVPVPPQAAAPAQPPPAPPQAAFQAPAPVDLSPPVIRSRRRPGGFLRLHGLAEVGALPGPTGGVGLAGGLLWRWFRLELHAGYLAPRLLDRPELRARVSLFAFAVHGCARLGRGRLEVPLCLGLEAGGLPAVADTGRSVVGRWLAPTGGVGAAVRLHPRVALWAFLQGLAAVQRGTLAVREPGPAGELRVVHDPGIASARLALGVEVKFGDPR
ncbi:hypothetical protein OV203_46290 [Nannocystis sp. ILAH1]|uniref:hypothetical protein n=1 Tax=Nannocystis sp. ILAH1 TaxID=2996789 RepID=UPI00227071E3|nr:hypothetical protein [Nannocystis sp. ILAH1]MCY0994623.1 hypothetical protein [Nannocystis sp. ILAH1]